MSELKASKRKTVTIVYCGHRLEGKILSVGTRAIKFKIDRPGCLAMILDADKVEKVIENR